MTILKGAGSKRSSLKSVAFSLRLCRRESSFFWVSTFLKPNPTRRRKLFTWTKIIEMCDDNYSQAAGRVIDGSPINCYGRIERREQLQKKLRSNVWKQEKKARKKSFAENLATRSRILIKSNIPQNWLQTRRCWQLLYQCVCVFKTKPNNTQRLPIIGASVCSFFGRDRREIRLEALSVADSLAILLEAVLAALFDLRESESTTRMLPGVTRTAT